MILKIGNMGAPSSIDSRMGRFLFQLPASSGKISPRQKRSRAAFECLEQAFPTRLLCACTLIQMRNRDQDYRQQCAGADADPNPQISRS